ncbi:ATP-binding cassette domain-containing protein [Clostridium rectalis]|uniref:ATP-binding cassette domain-containing protein n=1 Tax=Clostridium rectalis TaxID=2040295 RepID=UPI000F640F69|nr:ATP-binding cassette domain-containing protein [Clostridium rectalis]
MKLEEFSEFCHYELSGGMAYRVEIGRTLSYEPNMMFMDEPFAALHHFTILYLQQDIINLYKKALKAIIFITHNIEEALLLGHRIIILDIGIVKKEYTIQEKYPRDLKILCI